MAVTSASLEQTFAQYFETLEPTSDFYTTRQQAFNTFQERGLPTLKDEAYKYTPVARFLEERINQQHTTAPVQDAAALDLSHLATHTVTLRDGRLNTRPDVAGAVQCLTFEEAYQQKHPAFWAHFAKHVQHEADSIAALNTALFEEGLFLYIPEGTVLDKPLFIDHYTNNGSAAAAITHPRLLIVAAPNSIAHVITAWHGTGIANAVVEAVVEESAQLNYYVLQTQLGADAGHIQTTQSYQAAHSIFSSYTFTWSGALVRNNLYCKVAGSHTETNMYGLYCLRAKQHVDNFTVADHQKPHTYSNELYKGLLADEATGVFNGRIYVRPDAQKTNAFQSNNNLVLSDRATLHTKPQLEIWADDVKCSHGTTTGQLDAEQLFYLRARGIRESTAQSLLRQAFVSEVINKVSLEPLRTALQASWLAQEESP